MKTMRRYFEKRFGRQKGSALLVSLMVMVGLSLLGLAFVAITETESAISMNERNSAQAQAAAEAGAKVVVEWFQDTDWARDRGLLPINSRDFKQQRFFDDAAKADSWYKEINSEMLFDKPFKGVDTNRFFGDGDLNPPTADVWISRGRNPRSTTYLDNLNALLFIPDTIHNESVRITDIRVYAPPIPGGARNGSGFWETNAARYGVATVRVTAQKLAGERIVAERSVKAVIAETPFPTVDGAIETSGTLVGAGSFEVYWGKVLSEKGIDLKRAVAGMPWFDAANVINFEYGYDSAKPWQAAKVYAAGDEIMAPLSTQNNVPDTTKFSYRASGGTSDATNPPTDAQWPVVVGGTTPTDGTVTWTAVPRRAFPMDNDFYRGSDWLYQVVLRDLPDPWLHARARQEIVAGKSGGAPCGQAALPHPCDYDAVGQNVETYLSNMFQNQITTDPLPKPERVEAVFPTMDYEFWKNVALSGNNEVGSGVYYFRYADPITGTHNEFIGPGGARRSIYEWLNAAENPATRRPMNGLGAGFYFFDSKNARNPQFGKGGLLTPTIRINSGSVDDPFQMQGYIYLNAEFFGTSGSGSITPDDVYPMPGEPFRDVGFREVNELSGPNFEFRIVGGGGALPGGDFVWLGRNNGIWDYQDVNTNGQFDLFLAQKATMVRPDTSEENNVWLPVPFFQGCTPGVNCSEPHEPYLNMTYFPDVFSGSNPTTGVKIEWYDPSIVTAATIQQYRKPKRRTGLNTTVTCDVSSSVDDCTSNSYDSAGALVHLDALLWGAMYNEGGYSGSGNAIYYGALLMRASFEATGTPTVYFNECLAKGCLEEQLRLNRVTMTSWQTD
jgi:hypothetical protein